MTKINKLEMKGFKSFAKRSELIFGDNFNCVIGPNGSGKSNILDALCFVLGRSSAKGLRSEKSANLIYNGGKLKNPAKEGEVSIYLDNSNKLFPCETPEVKVSRIVKHNGTGVYKINDKKCTKVEVQNMLAYGKITSEGFNIILQGDIVKFIDMKLEDRRKIIEEVAGINVYEEKRQKIIKKASKNRTYNSKIEYYLEDAQCNYDLAYFLLTQRQTTFSLNKCIKKYGEVEGTKKWNDRQKTIQN